MTWGVGHSCLPSIWGPNAAPPGCAASIPAYSIQVPAPAMPPLHSDARQSRLLFQPSPFAYLGSRSDQEQRLLAAGGLKAQKPAARQQPAHLLSLWGHGGPRTQKSGGLSPGSPASRTAPPAPLPPAPGSSDPSGGQSPSRPPASARLLCRAGGTQAAVGNCSYPGASARGRGEDPKPRPL